MLQYWHIVDLFANMIRNARVFHKMRNAIGVGGWSAKALLLYTLVWQVISKMIAKTLLWVSVYSRDGEKTDYVIFDWPLNMFHLPSGGRKVTLKTQIQGFGSLPSISKYLKQKKNPKIDIFDQTWLLLFGTFCLVLLKVDGLAQHP